MVRFFTEDVTFSLPQKTQSRQWLTKLAESEGYKIGELNYIFCSDDYLLQVNRDYLDHDYYTDIITFDNSEEEDKLEGDIFISIDRVNDNGRNLNVPLEQELRRVIAHGLIHLCGYGDKTDEEAQQMRQKEEESLRQWSSYAIKKP